MTQSLLRVFNKPDRFIRSQGHTNLLTKIFRFYGQVIFLEIGCLLNLLILFNISYIFIFMCFRIFYTDDTQGEVIEHSDKKINKEDQPTFP